MGIGNCSDLCGDIFSLFPKECNPVSYTDVFGEIYLLLEILFPENDIIEVIQIQPLRYSQND